MKINIHSNQQYRELTITDGGASISSGLLDNDEMLEIAKELLNAGLDLLPSEYTKLDRLVTELINKHL